MLEGLLPLLKSEAFRMPAAFLLGALVTYRWVALPWKESAEKAQAKLDVFTEMARAALGRSANDRRRRGE